MMEQLQVQKNENEENKKKQKMEYVIEGNVAKFTTSSGVEFFVDLDDAPMVAQYSWCISTQGYVVGRVDGKIVRLHRLIMGVLDSEDNLVCDHINGNKTLNCKSNLRLCTQQQNSWNTNAKGYRELSNGTYKSYIMVDGKYINLGNYDTPEQANAVRIMAEKEYFGEFSSNVHLFEDAEVLRLYQEALASIEYLHQNKYRVEDDIVYVTVSYKDVSKEFVIDAVDYEDIKEYKWRMRTDGQIEAWIDGERQLLARYLMGLKKGEKKRVTFIDGNNLNFRRENLKVVECKTKK